jgi:hypothetical protein
LIGEVKNRRHRLQKLTVDERGQLATLEKYFPRRDRAFIRALLDADCKRLKPQISRDVILFMHAYLNTRDAYFVQNLL